MPQLAIPLDDAANKPGEVSTDGNTTKVEMPAGSTNTQRPPAEKPAERPAWLPEGFDTPEAFAEAYKTLKDTPKPETKPAEGEALKEGTKLAITTPEEAARIAQEKGVDLSALAQEMQENGELSEDTLKSLEAKGIPRTAVFEHIEGQKAKAALFMQDIATSVGGADKLDGILAWSANGVPADEIEFYNKMLSSTDANTVKLALGALKGKMEAALGVEGDRVVGEGTPGASGAKPFKSQAEVTAAMRDPRYQKDPAYRASVAARLAVTT